MSDKDLGERAPAASLAAGALSGDGARVLTADEVRIIEQRFAGGQWDELDLLALCASHEALRVAP